VRAVREGMSRVVGAGRLRLGLEGLVGLVVGRERMVKDVRWGMGMSLNVLAGGADEDVLELDAVGVEEVAGGRERTMRLVTGSAV